MNLFQYNCIEGASIDSRQANAVLRKRPVAVFFEAPMSARIPGYSSLNALSPEEMSRDVLDGKMGQLKEAAKRYPWVASDIAVYKNVNALWKQGYGVSLYAIDAPSELLQETLRHRWNTTSHPHRRGTHFEWWVYIYIRERFMAHNMDIILSKYKAEDVGLVFLQKFHWLNVKFLLSHPSKRQVFEYYFDAFSNTSIERMDARVENLKNPVLRKYWGQVDGLALG